MLNELLMRARTITKLRKNVGGGHGGSSSSSSSSSTINLRIIIYVALGLVLVCAMALIRMTFHISEVNSVQAVAKSLAALNNKDMTARVGGGGGGAVRNDIGEQDDEDEDEKEGEGDVFDERGDQEGDDMTLAAGGGLIDIQNVGPPVLPDLPPLPQGAGSLEEKVWEEKNGTYPFTGTVGCASSSSSSPTPPCMVHFPLQPNETSRKCQDSCLRTQKGQKFADMTNQNQDRSLLVQPLRFKNQQQQQPQETDVTANNNFLILLADGHGNTGHHAAEQVVRDLPFRILQSLEQLQSPLIRGGGGGGSSDDAIISILTKDFLAADVETMKTPGGGTTGIIAVRLGPSLYLAQAGDSFAFVVRWNKSGTASIVTEAVRHKPADPLERQRIEAAGGQVMMPPIGGAGGTSRVVIPDPNGGMLAEALAMSRSLGDENGKKLGLLTAEPSVVHVDLDQLKKDGGVSDCKHFLVVSSDGVLDFFPPQEVANFISYKLYQAQPPIALEQIMAQTLDMAARRWRMQMTMGGYRDDMTLIISKL